MAFRYGFFNSRSLDRTYTAEDFTEYLSSIICDGILDTYGTAFTLTAASSGLKVRLGRGKAWIDGHYFVNDASYSIDLSQYMDESLPRYVAIAIVCDTSDAVRTVSLEITPGTPAENPSLPKFASDENKTRLLMYAVRMNPGRTSFTDADWYDYRADKNVCGYCRCILGKCKVTEMLSQMEQILADIKEYKKQVEDLNRKSDTMQMQIDDFSGAVVSIGEIGENAHYILYSNGTLLIHGIGATFSYALGDSPFWENENIKKLVISDGITEIGSSVFERCSNLATASFPNTLTKIGERAFFMYKKGGLTKINFPASLSEIGEKAFVDNAVKSITLPATLTNLDIYLFMGCELESVRVECETIPNFCFTSCGVLHELTLSKNVKTIGSHIINYCYLLTSITYEGSLADWEKVKKYDNWDGNKGSTNDGFLNKVVCIDGYMEFDRETREWKAVKE